MNLDEESLRIIRALKKSSRDAESSWSIDVGDLLSGYLKLLEINAVKAHEESSNEQTITTFTTAPMLGSLFNFSTASTMYDVIRHKSIFSASLK